MTIKQRALELTTPAPRLCHVSSLGGSWRCASSTGDETHQPSGAWRARRGGTSRVAYLPSWFANVDKQAGRLAVCDTDAGERAANEIRSSTDNEAVAVAALELTDLTSVRAFVSAWDGPLDILVNNAGVMAIQELTLTTRGYEMQFATNHLGHIALALGLHDALAAADGARIVSVSSSSHLRWPVVSDDLHHRFRSYDPFGAYGSPRPPTSCSPSARPGMDRRDHGQRTPPRRNRDRSAAPRRR